MNAILLHEPELEFGTGKHVDIRFGLMSYGPVDFDNSPASRIRVGVVGTAETIEGFANWLCKCRNEIPARASNHPYLFTKFPGFSLDTNLKSTVEIGNTSCRPIIERDITRLLNKSARNESILAVAKLFLEEVSYLASSKLPQVIVCAPPLSLQMFIASDAPSPEEQQHSVTEKAAHAKMLVTELDFHDWLKANALTYGVPLQVIWPSTYDESKCLPQRAHRKEKSRLQDEATRAWNLHIALYYKAGGVPWRICRSATDLMTLYMGVSFYKALDNERLLTSMAQVFNERGEGVIVRGGVASRSKADRQVHMDAPTAERLMDDALAQYHREHYTLPARIVVHKSSSFNGDEIEGFSAAISNGRVHSFDLVHLSHADTRAFRDGSYPPLRGTFINIEDHQHLLYTRGSVEFFSVYPGMYVPHPLQFSSDHLEQTPTAVAQEILALTKMNWNHTQFDGLEPITLRAARQVGSILKYIPDPMAPYQPRYSFYM